MLRRIEEANKFLEAGNYDDALRLAAKELDENPDDPRAKYIAARCHLELERPGLALPICKDFVLQNPNIPQGWDNLGQALHYTWKLDEAFEAFRKGLSINPRDFSILNGLSLVSLYQGKYDQAIQYADRSLDANPEALSPAFNKSLAYLAKGEWEAGWRQYEIGLGKKDSERKEFSYKEPPEPRWDGSLGRVVVTYGEQGLGDEILFSSCIPDLIRDCEHVIIDCSKRLEGLFARSFPEAEVHGSRHEASPEWDKSRIDARVAMGSLPLFYRAKPEQFPRRPWLVADPARRKHWRAILDGYPGPRIGLAWTGGSIKTGRKLRSVPLVDLEPLLDLNATFVSLEHRSGETHERILDFGRWINTDDYDDTAALVAELDLVISVTTAVVDLAGALGKKCHVLVPEKPMWRYAQEPNPWYDIHQFRQLPGEPWAKTVRRYVATGTLR